jgi:hypothetical protein
MVLSELCVSILVQCILYILFSVLPMFKEHRDVWFLVTLPNTLVILTLSSLEKWIGWLVCIAS